MKHSSDNPCAGVKGMEVCAVPPPSPTRVRNLPGCQVGGGEPQPGNPAGERGVPIGWRGTSPAERGASRGRPPLTFVRLPSLRGESGPRNRGSAGATPRLRGPSRAPGGNPQARQTLSGSQSGSRTKGSAIPSRTQRLGGVSKSAGARVRAPQSTRVRVRARVCVCVCARVCV
ncbi:collagen alpha-1(II) chain-like [Rhinolophus ferrumequinum]|uniref:collagen alpha-1(II) chain-like n=1 Tax=Rhinolophus ferrumequinum TaxID=59479 RepID=UPI00140FD947|nr:collagen alpha-1(II) chain-like [Rhinolophus ferrumequinum]